jgi:hypothetical protein
VNLIDGLRVTNCCINQRNKENNYFTAQLSVGYAQIDNDRRISCLHLPMRIFLPKRFYCKMVGGSAEYGIALKEGDLPELKSIINCPHLFSLDMFQKEKVSYPVSHSNMRISSVQLFHW